MTKFALAFAALATATVLAAAPVSAANSTVKLAQADVTVRVGEPARPVVKKKVIVRRPVVRERVVVGTPVVRSRTVVASSNCRTVTVRKHVNGRTVVSKVRRCG